MSRRTIAIGDIGSTAAGPFGSAVSSKFFVSKGTPMIRGSNLSTDVGTPLIDKDYVFLSDNVASKFTRSQVRRGDLVFTCWGTIEQVGWIPPTARYQRYVVSNKQMMLRPDPKVADDRFLYYYFCSPMGQAEILERRIGSSVPGFNLGGLRSIPIPLPSIGEQRAISSALGSLDDKIELNRRMSATLEGMARALFRSWFVDFDPVQAKARGEAPAHMDPATAALFPDRFGENGLPEGWIEGALFDAARLNPEKWGSRNAPPSVEYVDLSNTKWGVIEATTMFDWPNAPSRARMILRKGDTVVGTVRPGNGSYAFIGVDGLTGSTGFAVLRPGKATNDALIYLAATDPENIDALAHRADGAAYPAVRPDVVAASPLTISPTSVRAAFADTARPLLAGSEAAKAESRTLAALRDALLPKLMSGEIRVRDAARLAAEAV